MVARVTSVRVNPEDIDEQTTVQARCGRQVGADIVDALLDLHEQRMKRRMGQGEQGAP